jgi:hypothetical protein
MRRMTRFTTDDGLTVSQEGPHARATAGRLDILFPGSDATAIAEAYRTSTAQAQEHFLSRWSTYRGPNIDAASFGAMIQEAALNWMYFYIANRLPLEIADRDWEHPQTRRVIKAVVERSFPTGSDAATDLCAQLMGISRDDYLSWADGEEWLRTIM